MKHEDVFFQGVVAALDVVALYGNYVIFREIVEATGKEEMLREIQKNGSEKTKEMAIQLSFEEK